MTASFDNGVGAFTGRERLKLVQDGNQIDVSLAQLGAAMSMKPVGGGLSGADGLATTKRVTLPIGGNGGVTAVGTITAWVQRSLLALPVNTLRWRIRGSNWNVRDQVMTPAGVTYSGFFLGDPAFGAALGSWAGGAAAPLAQALPGVVAPADGSEWVSDWVADPTLQFKANQIKVFSFRATCGGGVTLNGIGNGGITFNNAAAGQESAAGTPGGVASYAFYTDIRIEYETTDNSRVVVVIGDSIPRGTIEPYGQSIGDPFPHQTWPGIAASRNRFAVCNASIGGSTLQQWAGPITDQRWAEVDLVTTVPDAAIIALGTNDFSGRTLAQMQADFLAIAARLRSLGIPRLYACTLIPWKNGSNGNDSVRIAFNAWLRALPGLSDVFDMEVALRLQATAAQADPDFMDNGGGTPANSAIHPKLAGLKRMAKEVVIR